MRFKPPPPNAPEIGWRVEFRPMEVQLTDEENAAFVIFIVLMTRLILSFNLDMLLPISKVNAPTLCWLVFRALILSLSLSPPTQVEENMAEAQKRNAARSSAFWFRKDITLPQCVVNAFARAKPECQVAKCLSEQLSPCNKKTPPCTKATMYSSCSRMSIDEIINGGSGDSSSFPGLVPLLNFYLDSMEIDAETRCTISHYLSFITARARGTIPTPATIIRDFIGSHADYKKDSVVSETITYDLLQQLALLQSGKQSLRDLIGKIEKMKQK